ncbi:MAG TPA: TIGR03000 domain-containing protein [Gemmatales bacterium]|nr:TIGR03000 domain-containing protein [Gemmatales bacterium]HMP15377.1 TIGR03000 domain-containing protein [Gemmatales bacterium]
MKLAYWNAVVMFAMLCSQSVAQPPKAQAPRNLPDSPAKGLPDKESEKQEDITTPALIKVKLPENAVIWFENQKMSQSGSVRVFQSPALEPRKTYYYKIKVSWPTGFGTLTRDFVTEQEVAVKAGETTSIDFTPLVTHTKEVKPTNNRDLIRQAAHNTPPPERKR